MYGASLPTFWSIRSNSSEQPEMPPRSSNRSSMIVPGTGDAHDKRTHISEQMTTTHNGPGNAARHSRETGAHDIVISQAAPTIHRHDPQLEMVAMQIVQPDNPTIKRTLSTPSAPRSVQSAGRQESVQHKGRTVVEKMSDAEQISDLQTLVLQLDQQITDLKRANEGLQFNNVHLKRENTQLLQHHQTVAGLKHENDNLQAITRQMRREITQLKAEQAAEVSRLQNAVFQSIKETRWQPMDDNVVKHELAGLQSAISKFAKDNATQDSQTVTGLDADQAQRLVIDLGRSGVAQFASAEELMKIFNTRSGPRLCLTGLLTCKIFNAVFQDPYFFMREDFETHLYQLKGTGVTPPSNSSRESDLGEDLSLLYETFDEIEPREANIWRSDTLRLFMPNPSNQSQRAEEIRELVRSAISLAATRFASSFVNSCARVYLRAPDGTGMNSVSDSIRGLFEDVATFAIRLWAQRTKIRCRSWAELHTVGFQVNSAILEAHTSHKLDDSEDHRLDGQLIKMVLSPAVLRMGTTDGERYDRGQVWAKAVVLLAE